MIEKELRPLMDPREKPRFRPAFYPLSDMSDPPPQDTDSRNHCIRLRFLSVYYELNVLTASLQSEGISADEKEHLEGEFTSLKKARDELEDFYAPLGIIAEPTFVEGFAGNINFTFPNESRWFQQRQVAGPREAELRFSAPGPNVRNK